MGRAVLRVGGLLHEGWESVSVTRSLEQLCGSFEVSLAERARSDQPAFEIRPGAACHFELDGTRVIDGYVSEVTVRYDEGRHALSISGRDRTGDLVDCSVSAGSWMLMTLAEIAASVVRLYGVSVVDQVRSEVRFPQVAAQPGESVFRLLSRLAAMQGALLVSDRAGGLQIVRAGAGGRAAVVLRQGENIKGASLKVDHSEVFSEITVKGQSAMPDLDETPDTSMAPSSTVSRTAGSGARRYRPLTILAEASADAPYCANRAQWEVAVREAKSRRLSVSVQGWHSAPGVLWDVNQVVRVESPWLRTKGNWLIAGCRYRLDAGGTGTELDLVAATAYTPQPDMPDPESGAGGIPAL